MKIAPSSLCSRYFRLRIFLALVPVLLSCLTPVQAESIYLIGNSVTANIEHRGFEVLAQSGGHIMPWGRHMIPGAPLQWIWDNPEGSFQQAPYGFYTNALPNFEWDFLSLQPFDRDRPIDEEYCKKFIDLALPQSPNLTVLIYARWPRLDEDFDTRWLRPLDDPLANRENKAFFEQLTLDVRTNYPGRDVFMVPMGHVMYELSQRIQAGSVPLLSDITDLYEDGIHLNNLGSYLLALTFYTAVFRDDPRGLPVPAEYGSIDPDLVDAFQDVVLDIVAAHELSGVILDLPFEVGTRVLSPAIENITYSKDLNANFGIPPFSWTIAGGALPSGFSLSPNGIISGVSSTLGSYTFTVEVTDATTPTPQTAQAELTLSVEEDTTPTITTISLPDGHVGTPYARGFSGFTATNGNGSLSWIISSNALPYGLSLSAKGEISGSPQETGSFSISVTVTDSDSTPDSSQQAFTLTVAAAESTTLNARKILADVTLDGNPNEAFWALTNSLEVVTGGTNAVLNEGAVYDVVWDSAYLYIAVDVADSEVYVNEESPLTDDAVHIMIDALHDNQVVFNADDRQFVVGPYGRALEKSGRDSGILYAANRDVGSYSVEVAVPWVNLDLTPVDFLSIGFDIVVADDTDGTDVAGHLALGSTVLSAPSPADFSDLLFVDTVDSNGSQAGLMAVESFDYRPGQPLDGKNGGLGWAAEWDVQNNNSNIPGYQVLSTSPLTYEGLVSSPCYGMGSVSYTSSGRSFDMGSSGAFAAVRDSSTGLIGADGAEVWIACLLRRESASSYNLIFHQTSGNPWYDNTSNIKLTVDGDNWALSTAGGTIQDTGIAATVGETFLMVLKISYGATDDVALFVNPELHTIPTSPDAEVTGAADLQFKSLKFYPGTDVQQGTLDELRIGTSYASVVPTVESAPQVLSEIEALSIPSGSVLSLPADLKGNNLEVSWTWNGQAAGLGSSPVGYLYPVITTNAGSYIFTAQNRLGSVTGTAFQVSVTGTSIGDWRQAHFGTSANSGDAADDADPAGDGMPNLYKYAIGVDPYENAELPAAVPGDLSGGCASIEFLHATNSHDIVVTARGTTNLLANWVDVATYQGDLDVIPGTGSESLREPSGEAGRELIRICAPFDTTEYYLRLDFEKVPVQP